MFWRRAINFAVETKQNLRACCLVCRAWVPRCRYYLFEAITVKSAEQLEHMVQCLYRSSDLLTRVVSIIIDGSGTIDHSWIVQVPTCFPLSRMNAKHITIRSVDLSKLPQRFIQSFSLFRPLNHLYLHDLRYSRFSQLERLAYATQATYVELDHCQPEMLDYAQHSTVTTAAEGSEETLTLHGPPRTYLKDLWVHTSWNRLIELFRKWVIISPLPQNIFLMFTPESNDRLQDNLSFWSKFVELFRNLAMTSHFAQRIQVDIRSSQSDLIVKFCREWSPLPEISEHARNSRYTSMTPTSPLSLTC
ncbi:hypothetical protein BXZ70DRAFT_106294 [Cristinia sonorae]|uniref:Uncharacterized protein n=1 Tax=Cristinia sonorae TaxID=1940300 RepID=A0A8K0UQ64_9AGAR|nr:hypothetical protein BXZ70DRAFT_106294 [Cristinia sonorae]